MNKKLFIDSSITLTKDDMALIKLLGFEAKNLNKNEVDFSEIEYLLLHSKLSDKQLLAMKNCQYIGIRAHNTDYVNDQITSQRGIMVKGLQNQHGINAVAEHTFSLIFLITYITQPFDV
jgi:glycerate dehydrogenase/D-3-phosphoglycerate dehydrogenase